MFTLRNIDLVWVVGKARSGMSYHRLSSSVYGATLDEFMGEIYTEGFTRPTELELLTVFFNNLALDNDAKLIVDLPNISLESTNSVNLTIGQTLDIIAVNPSVYILVDAEGDKTSGAFDSSDDLNITFNDEGTHHVYVIDRITLETIKYNVGVTNA